MTSCSLRFKVTLLEGNSLKKVKGKSSRHEVSSISPLISERTRSIQRRSPLVMKHFGSCTLCRRMQSLDKQLSFEHFPRCTASDVTRMLTKKPLLLSVKLALY